MVGIATVLGTSGRVGVDRFVGPVVGIGEYLGPVTGPDLGLAVLACVGHNNSSRIVQAILLQAGTAKAFSRHGWSPVGLEIVA